MAEALYYFLLRWFTLSVLAYTVIWVVCFRYRRSRWVLPLWIFAALPLALLTLSIPAGEGFSFLFLLPAIPALGVLGIAVPRKPGWNLPALAATAAVMAGEVMLLRHWAAVPPTAIQVTFEIRNVDDTPIAGAMFAQAAHHGIAGRTPAHHFTADARGIIEICTDARGELNGLFTADGMDSQSVYFRSIGSEEVPGQNAININHTWQFNSSGYVSFQEQYSTERPYTREVRCIIYLRPQGSFATLPYWKDAPSAAARFTRGNHRLRIWRSAAYSVFGDELLASCRGLMAGTTEDQRIGLDIIQAMISQLNKLTNECEKLAEEGQSEHGAVKRDAAGAARAILEWAQISARKNDDPLALLSRVIEQNAARISEWEKLRPPSTPPAPVPPP